MGVTGEDMIVDLRHDMKDSEGDECVVSYITFQGVLMGSSFHPCVPVEYQDNEPEPPCVREPDMDLIGCGWAEMSVDWRFNLKVRDSGGSLESHLCKLRGPDSMWLMFRKHTRNTWRVLRVTRRDVRIIWRYKVLWIENHSSIQSKLTIIKIYDEYVNVLRGMYSARFNGSAPSHVDSTQVQSAP